MFPGKAGNCVQVNTAIGLIGFYVGRTEKSINRLKKAVATLPCLVDEISN